MVYSKRNKYRWNYVENITYGTKISMPLNRVPMENLLGTKEMKDGFSKQYFLLRSEIKMTKYVPLLILEIKALRTKRFKTSDSFAFANERCLINLVVKICLISIILIYLSILKFDILFHLDPRG